MASIFRLILCITFLAMLSACSDYVDDYFYLPRPALADLPATRPDQPPVLTALASVVGVHRENHNEGIPASVEVVLRLENNGPYPVSFNPATLELSNSLLLKFPPPLLRPPEPVNLEPMQSVAIDAFFPFPPGHSWGDTDLNWLQLHWLIDVGGRSVRQVTNFRRHWPRYYYYPDYGPYWDYPPVGFRGAVIIRGR